MAFATIEQVGPSWDDVAQRLVRDLKAANKAVGKQVAATGRKAMLADTKSRRGSLRFAGKALGVKTKVKASAASCNVEFRGAPAGAWAIISTGTKPHRIAVRSRQALHWGGDAYAEYVKHPGTGGRQYWRSAGVALDKAVDDVIRDVYDDALTG